MERETGEYKTMAYGMGKCRNWEIIKWFISWKENITPHCTLKMRHLRHWTKCICLIQCNWEIPNAIFDTPSSKYYAFILSTSAVRCLTKMLQYSKIIKNVCCKIFFMKTNEAQSECIKSTQEASETINNLEKLSVILSSFI